MNYPGHTYFIWLWSVHSCSELTEGVLQAGQSCDFDAGTACNFHIPVYPHLWNLARYRYGNVTSGVIAGDVSSAGKFDLDI